MRHFETRYQKCPICYSGIKLWRKKMGDDGQDYTIDVCTQCEYGFVNPRPTMDFLMNYYAKLGTSNNVSESNSISLAMILKNEQEYPNSTIDAKRMIDTINKIMDSHGKKSLLDIGCGYGFFTQAALKTGFTVTALELSDHGKKITKELTGIEPVSSSFETFSCASSFDVIMMSQILEHALDIHLWIEKAYQYLTAGGVLAIALPNFSSAFRKIMQEREPFICPPEHLNFFSLKNLTQLLQQYGFVVEKMNWQSRLPMQTVQKYLPGYVKAFTKVIYPITKTGLKTLDLMKLGSVLNIYARKQ